MRASWLMLSVLGLTACRIGFDGLSPASSPDAASPDAAPPVPGVARIVVTGEEGESLAGQPIAGAHVIVVEDGGAPRFLQTPADGTVTTMIAGRTTIHVIRPTPDLTTDWLIQTFSGLQGNAEVLAGGRPRMSTAGGSMTVNLPAFPDVSITGAAIRGPAGCVVEAAPVTSTTVVFDFSADCLGDTVPLYAQGFASGPVAFIALGPISLTAGATLDATAGTWLEADKLAHKFDELPADVDAVYGEISLPGAPATSTVPISSDSDGVDQLGVARLVFDTPPVVPGTLLMTEFDDVTGTRPRFAFEQVDSWPGNRLFDLTKLEPIIEPAVVDPTGRVSWTVPSATADLVVIMSMYTTTGGATVQHLAYAPPGDAAITFPALPPSLSSIAPTGATRDAPALLALAMSDYTYATLTPIIDRDLFRWVEGGEDLPQGTFSIAAAFAPMAGRRAPAAIAAMLSPGGAIAERAR